MSTPLELSFVTLDVFTTKRFAGNPLAVVHVPNGVTVAQETKQTVAREFNFSETVFLHEATGDGGRDYPVDIFTIDQELPFAGHPTIGTASHVLSKTATADAAATLLVKAGRIPIERVGPAGPADPLVVRAAVPHDVHVHAGHLRTTPGIDAVRDAGAIGHGDPAIAAAELDAPVVSIVRGMTFVLVRLASLAQLGVVSASSPGLDFARLPDLLDKGPWGPEAGGPVSRYYYVVTDASEEGVTNIRTRMIGWAEEDAATGSAACTLASYLTLTLTAGAKDKRLLRYNVTQGVEMGRRSDILVEVQAATDGRIEGVFLGGSAVEVSRGTIRV
ncbi:phenazine biosynthesis protein [Sporothrix schenckii 1099-18]|uniref:Phenazine biosynthesis protein n=1 Tax=Sporothrix schenckii 1099-18 TaxID=1397361 RepID=A0A0F2M1H1_SPOSC|nr:phenazine biosynthesis protein [Sporothrix schenckii 1099-18]KJR81991.1 phenazine biosynthesis protein [Sporothrix schenckii 1099-18]